MLNALHWFTCKCSKPLTFSFTQVYKCPAVHKQKLRTQEKASVSFKSLLHLFRCDIIQITINKRFFKHKIFFKLLFHHDKRKYNISSYFILFICLVMFYITYMYFCIWCDFCYKSFSLILYLKSLIQIKYFIYTYIWTSWHVFYNVGLNIVLMLCFTVLWITEVLKTVDVYMYDSRESNSWAVNNVSLTSDVKMNLTDSCSIYQT